MQREREQREQEALQSRLRRDTRRRAREAELRANRQRVIARMEAQERAFLDVAARKAIGARG